jgi:hypothetical protein
VTPPSPRPPLGPERLAKLLDDAVRHVTVRPDAFDRIRRGVRRRRTARRVGGLLLAVAVLAGGGSTALALTSTRGPSGLASSVAASGAQRSTTAATLTSAPAAAKALPPATAPIAAPSAASSGNSEAKTGYSSFRQASVGQPARWDVDGDGRPETVSIVPMGSVQTTYRFLLVVRLTALGTQIVPFSATPVTDMPPYGPVIVGAADAAHDGHAELFVQVDAGCCTEFWTIFRLVNGHIRQMTISGQPVRLPVGGSMTANSGFSCAGPDLAVYAYRSGTKSGTFLATRDTYRWAGAALVLASRQQMTINGTLRDRELARYAGVDCGSLPQYELVR